MKTKQNRAGKNFYVLIIISKKGKYIYLRTYKCIERIPAAEKSLYNSLYSLQNKNNFFYSYLPRQITYIYTHFRLSTTRKKKSNTLQSSDDIGLERLRLHEYFTRQMRTIFKSLRSKRKFKWYIL